MATPIGGIVSTSSFDLGLVPQLVTWHNATYDRFDTEYDKIFNVMKTDRAFERLAASSGIGLPTQMFEGDSVSFDSARQRYNLIIPMVQYGAGVIITRNAVEDNKTAPIAQLRGSELGEKMALQKEYLAGLFLDNGFSTSKCGDGGNIYANNHGILSGTFSNVPSSPAALSEASLEQAYIDITKNFLDERGLKIRVTPKKVVIPVNTHMEAVRIFKATGQVHTPDGVATPNAIREAGLFPEGFMVSHYMGSSTNWHVLTDINKNDDGLIFYDRRSPDLSTDNMFDNENLKVKSIMRLALAAFNPRCAYGVNA